jgi:hypothetical protein
MRRTAMILGSMISSIVIVGSAHAIPIEPGITNPLADGSDYTAAPGAADVGDGSFLFEYLFDVPANVTATIFASSHQPFPNPGDPSIADLTLSWLDAAGNPLPGASTLHVTNANGQTLAGTLAYALLSQTQAGADYVLRVMGSSTNGGRYDFDVIGAAAVTPVSLPNSAFLFGAAMAGLALVMRKGGGQKSV